MTISQTPSYLLSICKDSDIGCQLTRFAFVFGFKCIDLFIDLFLKFCNEFSFFNVKTTV